MLDKAAVAYQLVLTKVDKLPRAQLQDRLGATAEALRKRAAAHPEVLPTSAESGSGIPELRATVAHFAVG